MESNELKQKSAAELKGHEAELRKKLADLSLKIQMGTSTKTSERSKLRREIARTLTFLQLATRAPVKGKEAV